MCSVKWEPSPFITEITSATNTCDCGRQLDEMRKEYEILNGQRGKYYSRYWQIVEYVKALYRW